MLLFVDSRVIHYCWDLGEPRYTQEASFEYLECYPGTHIDWSGLSRILVKIWKKIDKFPEIRISVQKAKIQSFLDSVLEHFWQCHRYEISSKTLEECSGSFYLVISVILSFLSSIENQAKKATFLSFLGNGVNKCFFTLGNATRWQIKFKFEKYTSMRCILHLHLLS